MLDSFFKNVINEILKPLEYFIFALAIVLFLWGMLNFIMHANEPEARKTGYNHMIWAIVGIFIMASAIGIITLIKKSLGV